MAKKKPAKRKAKKYVTGASFAGGKTKIRRATPKGTKDRIHTISGVPPRDRTTKRT